jgi:superfamily II DNA or RNA helicase
MQEQEIVAGLSVYHTANPGRIGVLTGIKMSTFCLMAEVNWGADKELVDTDSLRVLDTNRPSSLDEDVLQGRYGTLQDLRRRMTFEKLRGLLTDVFYSMKTSEIDFYAHQFKPVLRFIDSPTNRLLVADEVGLGKTIEAGLIWTEWQAREKARRLLVICPPTLVPKWLRELQDRFQFPAEKADAKRLLELFQRFERSGPGLSFVAVSSYHSMRPLRQERIILQRLRAGASVTALEQEGIKLSPRVKLLHGITRQGEDVVQSGAQPFVDMVVFDESHSMRNTGSASYDVGDIVSVSAGATVCLSATPIHNQSRDLYALLRLIDPEVFRDQRGYDQLVEDNLPVVRLQNLLAETNWNTESIAAAVGELQDSEAKSELETLLDGYNGSPAQRVEMRHVAERINLLNGFINRTRKRDIMENRVIRKPVTYEVELSPHESSFYRAVLKLVRERLKKEGTMITSFHLLHPALRMSSCMPVMAEAIREGKWGGFEEMALLTEDYVDDDEEADEAVPMDTLGDYDFAGRDSKYDALRRALHDIQDSKSLAADDGERVALDPKEKVIVFAFFKATIAYLKKRLRADGFEVVDVTGDITDKDERDKILNSFASDDCRILLCSEIGAEGIDLQFARIVVNYDLPWNPMRVEQRIGRIDRIGQKSPNIVVINFYIKGTIDGSIYAHLYNKIGIFSQSIGALEGILGQQVNQLTRDLVSEDLTPEEMDEMAEQTGDAICNQAKEESKLEESTGALLAFGDFLSEQVGESQRMGRFIDPKELAIHAADFLAETYRGTDACVVVPDNPVGGCMNIKLSFRAFSDFQDYCQRTEQKWPDGFDHSTRTFAAAFDPAIHQENKRSHRGLVLVNHLHPFFRWITEANKTRGNQWPRTAAVRVATSEVPPGTYAYLIYRLTLEGITRKDAFHYAYRQLPDGHIVCGEKAEKLFAAAVERGESLLPGQTPDYSLHLAALREAIASDIRSSQERFNRDQRQKFEIRTRQLTSHFDRRIESQRQAVETVKSRGQQAQGLAGLQRALENLIAKKEEQLKKLSRRSQEISNSLAEVAFGLIKVDAASR